jgi:hypothetical protein
MVSNWAEFRHSRRRALADALAALREAQPLPPEVSRPLSATTERRVTAALSASSNALRLVKVGVDGTLDIALRAYLEWVEVETQADLSIPRGATMALRTRFQTPQALHAAMVEAICAEVGSLAQDL